MLMIISIITTTTTINGSIYFIYLLCHIYPGVISILFPKPFFIQSPRVVHIICRFAHAFLHLVFVAKQTLLDRNICFRWLHVLASQTLLFRFSIHKPLSGIIEPRLVPGIVIYLP